MNTKQIEWFKGFLIRFLCREGTYMQFMANIQLPKKGRWAQYDCSSLESLIQSTYNTQLKKVRLCYFFDYAFDWDITPEGFAYWEKLHHKFYYNFKMTKLYKIL